MNQARRDNLLSDIYFHGSYNLYTIWHACTYFNEKWNSVNVPEVIPVVAALIILSIWYFIFWSMGLSFSKTYTRFYWKKQKRTCFVLFLSRWMTLPYRHVSHHLWKARLFLVFDAAKRAGKVYWDNAHQQFVLTHVCMFCFQILPVGLFPHTSLPYHVNNVYTQLRGLITNTSTNEQRYCLLASQMIIFSSVQPVYAQTTNSSFSIIKSCDKFVINQAWRLYWALCPLLIL